MSAAPVIVLGMHKSGTTLVSETLHRSGVAMIEAEQAGGYDEGNKMERDATRALNAVLLDCAGRLSVRVVSPLDLAAVSGDQWQAGRDLVRALDAAGSEWGFKDPRTVLTFDFWRGLIERPRLIGVFRDPVEVFRHYARRPARRWLLSDPGYLPAALHAWCVYNQRLLEIARAEPAMLLLDYADVMTGPEGMARLEDFLGRPLVDCRRSEMRRSEARPTLAYRAARALVRRRHGLDAERIHRNLRALAAGGRP